MFEAFFYQLREHGVPVAPTAFLQLNKALSLGLVRDLNDFYVVARSLMVKRARHFDLYDRVFAHHFQGADLALPDAAALTAELKQTLLQWLKDPRFLETLPEEEQRLLSRMTPDEVVRYFLDRLAEQTGQHHGGSRWIGTGGTSPVGHSGHHPGGMRVGGASGNRSAVKVALDRRYIDYSADSLLTARQLGEALRTLRDMSPVGPRDRLNVDKTIYETVRKGGEIELVFDRRLRDKLSVFLFVDNGGWSMYPYVEVTRALFRHARDNFRKLQTFFFHNCIYDQVWEDPQRHYKPRKLEDIVRADAETRVIIVGDASMAPWELTHPRGAIDFEASYYQQRSGRSCLTELADRFRYRVWINPIRASGWSHAYGRHTIQEIQRLFPMKDLTLPGIEQAVQILRAG